MRLFFLIEKERENLNDNDNTTTNNNNNKNQFHTYLIGKIEKI